MLTRVGGKCRIIENAFSLLGEIVSGMRICKHCNYEKPLSVGLCPHCAWMDDYPNVFAAEQEQGELEQRYQDAMENAKGSGSESVLKDFENEVLGSTRAIINRSFEEVKRLVENTNELYATFYQKVRAGVRIPLGEKWDILRAVADDAFFPNYKEDIRFAALSLNNSGLFNYGECSLVLKESMIEHRATVLDENSVIFMKTHKVMMYEAENLPKGYRATWKDRGKTAVAKHVSDVSAGTSKGEYPKIILQNGKTTEDDIFIEVHIWGPMSILSFEGVTADTTKFKGRKTLVNQIRFKLDDKYNIKMEEV